MRKLTVLALFALLLAPLAGVALAQDDGAQAVDNSQERKQRILLNLQDYFPQLAQAPVTMGDIEGSAYPGLELGSFTVGNQDQSFLVSKDDTQLYLVAGEPLDVSRSTTEIQAAKAAEAEERTAALAGVIDGEPMRGNPEAPVTIIEFSDFQCPYCKRGFDTVEQILEKYDGDVNFVFKHFPLDQIHPWARPAAIASVCAEKQNGDAFWTLHDAYFENQSALNAANVVEKSREWLSGAEIDLDAWATCAGDASSEAYKAAEAEVQADLEKGQELGVSGTPGFFVNGQFLNGAQPMSAFEPIIAQATADSGGEGSSE